MDKAFHLCNCSTLPAIRISILCFKKASFISQKFFKSLASSVFAVGCTNVSTDRCRHICRTKILPFQGDYLAYFYKNQESREILDKKRSIIRTFLIYEIIKKHIKDYEKYQNISTNTKRLS